MLIDGIANLYRSFYAIPSLSTSNGLPTNAIYGFIRTVEMLFVKYNPGYACIVFDGGRPKERLDLFSDYKKQRPSMPESLRIQIPYIERYASLRGVRCIRVEGEEADDVIASIVRRFEGSFERIFIASEDKDLFQIVNEKVCLIYGRSESEIIGSQEILNKTGVTPDKIVLWLALTGDSSDGIPGIRGIGAKRAALLANKFGNIEELMNKIDEVEPVSIRKALIESRNMIERNIELVKLRDVQLNFDLDFLKVNEINIKGIENFYKELGFKSLLDKLIQK